MKTDKDRLRDLGFNDLYVIGLLCREGAKTFSDGLGIVPEWHVVRMNLIKEVLEEKVEALFMD